MCNAFCVPIDHSRQLQYIKNFGRGALAPLDPPLLTYFLSSPSSSHAPDNFIILHYVFFNYANTRSSSLQTTQHAGHILYDSAIHHRLPI